MFARFLLLLLMCAGGVAPSLAQAPRDTTVALPTITVTAARAATSVAAAPARVRVLDAEAAASAGAQTVADLLEARSGAAVRRYGGGGLATLSQRGFGPSQTLVLLDGHRIADPQLGQLDLSLLPSLLLDRVEVVQGATSALYGTDGVAGVVNLRTVAPGTGRQVRVSGGYGAYGTHTSGLLVSGGGSRVAGTALVSYSAAAGDYPYRNEALFPAQDVRREGADRTHLTLYGAGRYARGRHRLRLAGWYNDAERGLPTINSSRPRGERQWDEHIRLWVDDEARFRRGLLRVGGLVQRSALRYINPTLGLDETGRTTLSSFEAEARVLAGQRWLLGGGLTAGYGQAAHPSLHRRAAEAHLGAFTYGTGSYGRLLGYPALRVDTYGAPGAAQRTALSPRLGLNVQLFEQPVLHLKVGAGRSFRVPTFNDRFWQPGGNPALRPEQGWTYDVGLLAAHAAGMAEVTVFAAHLRDQIVWAPTAAGYWTPGNLSRVRTRGVEASYDGRWVFIRGGVLDGGLIYTLTDARDRSDPASAAYDRPVRFVPRHQLKPHVGLRLGPLRMDLNARYLGRRAVATDGSQHLAPHFILDGQVRVQQRLRHVAVTLGMVVENLTDRSYTVLPAHPMPPRHARLHLLLLFR